MKNEIEIYLNTIDLDVRKTGNARFFDQKVQPDVLSAVCECIIYYIDDKNSFTVNDVRYCEYSNELVTEIFNKPEIAKAGNEYDKFFSQPLKMLAYCGLIDEDKSGRTNVYVVNQMKLLEYISLRDRNAYYFLALYLEKVLKDSDIFKSFDRFFTTQTKDSLYRLRDEYIDFIISNTPINGETETIRIFNPLLNTLCFSLKKFGSKSGQVSVINYNDLLYNRPNWRDFEKDKSITREEFNSTFEQKIDNSKFYKYQIEKSKKFVKKLHPWSEIHRFSAYPAIQAHHIFLSSRFPELADRAENIIAITPNQHFQRAHPNNKTAIIDESYQVICLISKLDSIEIDYMAESGNYSKKSFIDVLNIGFEMDIDYTVDFEELKHRIMQHNK